MIGILSVILVAAIFTHVFENLYIRIIVFLLVLGLATIALEKSKYIRLVILAYIVPLVFLSIEFIAQKREKEAFREAYLLFIAGERNVALELLEKNTFDDNPKSISLKTQILLSENSITSVSKIETLLKIYPDPEGYRRLGDLYVCISEIVSIPLRSKLCSRFAAITI